MDRTRSLTEACNAVPRPEAGKRARLTGSLRKHADSECILTPVSFLADTGICAAVVALFLAPLIAIALY